MKSKEVVAQLISILPRYTDLFGDNVSITSLTRSGAIVTAITSAIHGLTTGEFVYINGALTPVTISTLTRINDIATAITASNHDLTLGYQETVAISGTTQSDYNGVHDLLNVQNRRTFSYSVANEPITPATGTPKIIFDLPAGYNGIHQITKIDNTSFSYAITSEPETPAQGTIILKRGLRISDAISLERANESYTKQNNNKLWAYVVLGGHSASKDRRINTDATYTYNNGQDFRQLVIQPFKIYVFVPTTTSISGSTERDLIEDVSGYLFKSLLRFSPTPLFSDQTDFGIIFSRHDIIAYTGAYYIHEFEFETQYYLSYQDTIENFDNVAFRDLRMQFISYLNATAGVIMDTNVNLDATPLI